MHRNWPWVVPVGGCITLLGIIAFFLGAAFFGIQEYFVNFTEQVTQTVPIDRALKRIEEYPYVTEILGTPITTEGSGVTNVQIINGINQTSSQTRIKGSKSTGILYLTGSKKDSLWSFSEMYVVLNATGEEVNLFYDGEQ